MIDLDPDVCHRALSARDARFDGVFFTGVKTTGVYCRPVCTARTPRRESCRFFACAAAAEREGFRPCLRCRPELAPGHAPMDAGALVAQRALARVECGALDNGAGVDDLAREFAMSARQLRRVVRERLGATPIELAQTRRLLLAKQLLTETRLPVIDVAFASGFASVRRFNALFLERYRLTPSALRRNGAAGGPRGAVRLTLAYRPPLAWGELLGFLSHRVWRGAEHVSGARYARTVSVTGHRGWIAVEPVSGRDAVVVECSESLAPALGAVLERVRALFDLGARPDVIGAHLGADARLAGAIARRPGLRVPGAFDGFETAIRAVLGQQVSVRAATTLAGRLVAALGEEIETPFKELIRQTPSAERLIEAGAGAIAAIGLPRARAESIVAIARAVASGRLRLAPGADPEAARCALLETPGVGPWTAGYVCMRALRWPDAFPEGDLGLRKAVGARTNAELAAASEAWRPWRAYAAMHLWESLGDEQPVAGPAASAAAPARSLRKVTT